MARQRTKAEIPALNALYAPVPPAARATEAAGEDVQTIEPPRPLASMERTAYLQVKNAPVRFVARTRSHTVVGSSCTSPPMSIPAFAKRPYTDPSRSSTEANAI